MTDTWDFYFARVNDVTSSIAVNMSARAIAPDSARAQLLWVWVPMRAPRPDGLSSADEAPTLADIEDELTDLLAREAGAISVGRITGDARREFYFYAPGVAPLETLVATVLARQTGYTSTSGQQPDPTWSQYLDVLYPSKRDYQHIQNRHVLHALAEAGDDSERERPIEHWAYFADGAARDAAARKLEGTGFIVTERAVASGAGERAHGLRFRHDGPATQAHIDDATWRVLDALEGLDAEYDGWESPVMSAPPRKGLLSKLFGR